MKLRTVYVCQQCSFETHSWLGKCPNCDTWNSLIETVKDVAVSRQSSAIRKTIVYQKLSDVKHIDKNRLKSGFIEFDRVMGGELCLGQ